jgi:hypothetical protein
MTLLAWKAALAQTAAQARDDGDLKEALGLFTQVVQLDEQLSVIARQTIGLEHVGQTAQ